jgi:hypothetical protein
VIYVVLDRSLSMSCPAGSDTRWTAVTKGLAAFAQDPRFASVLVGLMYFGTAASPPGSTCLPAEYVSDVDIGPLSTNGSAIVASLAAHTPLTDTPTLPALRSALTLTISWKSRFPGHAVGVALVTDGQPNACSASAVMPEAAVARAGFENGTIPTYVVGIVSTGSTCALDPNRPSVAELDAIAVAGGTREAAIVDTIRAGLDVQVADAFARIAADLPSSCLVDAGSTGKGGEGGTAGAAGADGAGSGGFPDSGGATSTGGVPVCNSGQKMCGGVCVPGAPSNGCGETGCTPCPGPPPMNGVLACNQSNHTCDFVCLSGFTKSGSACVSNSGAGGGDGGVCVPSQCPDCGSLIGPGCCVNGHCGCPAVPFVANSCQ